MGTADLSPSSRDPAPGRRIEIVLARHGKPDLPQKLPRIGRTELAEWGRRYNAAGIDREVAPPPSLLDMAARSACIVASNLRRSMESANWVAGGRSVQVRPDLHEARLPEQIPLPLRLRPGAWVALARIVWWLDVRASAEPIGAARNRASEVAGDLIALAERHGTVLVVGHGTFNRFISSRLRRLGWSGARVLPLSYWGAGRYTRDAAPPT